MLKHNCIPDLKSLSYLYYKTILLDLNAFKIMDTYVELRA